MCIYMHMCVHVCMYMCMCICMYMYICVSVYMYACTYICTRVWVYICTREGTFCLFVLSNPSTTCVCITEVLSTPACVCCGELEVRFFFKSCSCLALVVGLGVYVLTGVEIGALSCVFLFLRVSGWWVGVCLYMRARAQKLLGYLMWAQV